MKSSIYHLLNKTVTRIKNGYLQFFNKINRKWVWLHRFIAQIFYGKPIPKGYEVHHIDKNKLNNSPDNLVVISKEEHQRIHSYDRRKLKDSLRFFNNVKKFDTISFERSSTNNVRTYDFNGFYDHIYKTVESNSYKNVNYKSCPRCFGTGYLPHYNHVQKGICFRCWGTGRG